MIPLSSITSFGLNATAEDVPAKVCRHYTPAAIRGQQRLIVDIFEEVRRERLARGLDVEPEGRDAATTTVGGPIQRS